MAGREGRRTEGQYGGQGGREGELRVNMAGRGGGKEN